MEQLGIRLGLHDSAVARATAVGTVETVYDEDGSKSTPSVVTVQGPDPRHWVVGAIARDLLYDDPKFTFGRFLEDLGTGRVYDRGSGLVAPRDLCTALLSALRRSADMRRFGNHHWATITAPVHLPHSHAHIRLAAQQAGFQNVEVIDEHSACSLLASSCLSIGNEGLLGVLDLGRSRVDASIVRLNESGTDLVATAGMGLFGGTSFNEKLKGIVRRAYESRTGARCQDADYSANHAEQDKIRLSKSESMHIRVRGDGGAANITITREQFEEAVSSHLKHMELLCAEVLEEAGIAKGTLKGVILAGGSTRIPAVQRAAERGFGESAHVNSDPVGIAARGAALRTAIRYTQYLEEVAEEARLRGLTGKTEGPTI